MTAPRQRGVRMNPRGPVTAGDLRILVCRLDAERMSNNALVEFTTPLAGDRRAVTIDVIDHEPADFVTIDGIDVTLAPPGGEVATTIRTDSTNG